jgi:hypothetical protein
VAVVPDPLGRKPPFDPRNPLEWDQPRCDRATSPVGESRVKSCLSNGGAWTSLVLSEHYELDDVWSLPGRRLRAKACAAIDQTLHPMRPPTADTQREHEEHRGGKAGLLL